MPLQLLYISTLIFLLVPTLSSTGPISKPGCEDSCGGLPIPYPFGVGLDCSLDPFFTIICNDSTHPQKPYLSSINREVVEIKETYILVKYPNLLSVCYDSSGVEKFKESRVMDWTGTPYRLAYGNRLTVIGCDVMLLQNNGSWVSGGCSAFCAEEYDNGGVGFCPSNGTSVNGCCEAEITGVRAGMWMEKSLLGAELIDLSGSLARRRHFPCSYAFIDVGSWSDDTVFSYPLFYLDNSTALENDNWASTSRLPVVRLAWGINGTENCRQARLSSTYACRADKSICVDDDFDQPGYYCNCVEGYEGNPYLSGGCKAISSSSSIAKSGCSDQCGGLSIPFPFGVGPNCSLAPSFEVTCNASTNPPKAYLRILNAEIINLNSSEVLIWYPTLGLACYNLSHNQYGIAKTEEDRLIIDLSGTQYMLSDKNLIQTVGCDDMLTGMIGQANKTSLFNTNCASVCWDGQDDESARCTAQGTGCCSASIRRGTTYLEANLSDLSGKWRRRKLFPCSFVFVEWDEPDRFYNPGLNDLTNLTNIRKYSSSWKVMLDWRVGPENCEEARRNPTNYACHEAHSNCVDFDTNLGGYLCNCSKGYHGNPYLPNGCQDIDECANKTTNPCVANSICINTIGSFSCKCPKWYTGDGRKDGRGCIEDKSKIVISIGIGSGLGFILLLLIFFQLYKMLQKRKEKMLKEKFFKRNGGMLLQQQTNEGTLGKPTVFDANELEVATDNFNESRVLGQGGQGTVYKGMLFNGKIVAIKKSKLVKVDQLEQFINEVVILSQINHRNIVKLLGCCLETEVPLLVYEFMPNGTLFDLIHDPNNEFPFPWNMRLKIAADIAGALAYLHSASSTPIYHRDIKSSNILLDEKYVVKVSDFGTSKSVATDQTHLTTIVKGTFGYLDPEYFQSSQFTEKSDVYSFGVVLVELLTGQRPISLDIRDEDIGLAARFLTAMEENDLDTILDAQVLDGKKEEVILAAKLAQRCLNWKGKMRPTMKEVATELESIRISKMPVSAKDEYAGVRDFGSPSMTLSETDEFTWTASYKSDTASPSDTNRLLFTNTI